MTKPTLLTLCALFPEQMERLEEEFEVIRLYKEPDPEVTLNAVRDKVTAIMATIGNQVHANLINALPNLQIIALKSVGYDYVDIKTASEKGIIVTNTPDLVTADTADTALGLLLNVSRRYVELDAYVRVGRWTKIGSQHLSTSLTGKRVGIAGLGRIGQAIAARCEAFDMEVCYFGRTKKDTVRYQYYDDIVKMAEQADYLIAVVPGGEATRHLIDENVLRALGQNGYIINISRGSVVDEEALIHALKNGIIKGAGLDVYTNEPNVPQELKTMDNVVLFPHVGANTYETMRQMGDLIIENLLANKAGKPVKTPVY